MKVQQMVLTVALAAAASPAVAQDAHQMTQAAGGSAEVAQCMQAQAVVAPALQAARARLEMARQANSAAAMRAAVDTLDAVLLDVRMRLEPCGQMSAAAAGPMAGQAMPSTSWDPVSAPAGQNMANMPGQNMATMPAPAAQKPVAAPPRAVAPAAPNQAAAPAGQNMANMPGHNMANVPAPATRKPAAATRRGAAPAAPNQAAPSAGQTMANMPGHNMANMPSPPSAAATKSGTPAATQPDMVEDPVSKTQVDIRTALRVLYQGRVYYFRSDKERQEFMKNPAKYVSAK